MDALQLAGIDLDIRDRLAAGLPGRMDADVGAHQAQDVDDPGPRRVEADPADHESLTGRQRTGDEEEGRRGNVARHFDTTGFQTLHRRDRDPGTRDLHGNAERGEHPLGMVARRRRFRDAGRAFGIESGQQQCRLHLGAGHAQIVAGTAQRRAAQHADRGVAVGGLEPCAHGAQRLGDPLHGPARQRGIADQRRIKALPGQQAHRQAHRRAGVAHVERGVGRLQPPQSHALQADPPGARRLDRDTHRPHRVQRRQAVGARQEALDFGDPVGDATEHHRAVRNRLVAGYAQLATDGALRADPVAFAAAAHSTALG